jgi:type IV pilus assembly protein PilO
MPLRAAFIDTLALVPRWQKLIVGLVALVAFGAAGYFIAILPVATRVESLRGQRDAQEAELVRMRPMTAEVMRLRREAAEVEERLEIAKNKLPTEREIPTFYRTLSEAAGQAGLVVTLFQPQTARVRDYYTEIPVSVVAEGGYHEFGDFLSRLATLPRAAMVSDLKLAAAKPPTSAPPATAGVGLRAPAPPATPGAPTAPSAPPRPRVSVADTSKARRSIRAEMTLLTFVYRPVGSPPPPKPPASATNPQGAKP